MSFESLHTFCNSSRKQRKKKKSPGNRTAHVSLPIRLDQTFSLVFLKSCRPNANGEWLRSSVRPDFVPTSFDLFFPSPFLLPPRSLKHWKLPWWLANLSEINLMGSACACLPRGCAFTAVLLIYSWKTALQCPSFCRASWPTHDYYFFFFALVLRHLFLCSLYFSLQISLLSPSLSEQLTSSKVAKPELQATCDSVWETLTAPRYSKTTFRIFFFFLFFLLL